MCYMYNVVWYILYNIICGIGSKFDMYLDVVWDKFKCNVIIFYGENDEFIFIECSYNVK